MYAKHYMTTHTTQLLSWFSSQWQVEASFKIVTWNTKTLQNQSLPIIAVHVGIKIGMHVSVTSFQGDVIH